MLHQHQRQSSEACRALSDGFKTQTNGPGAEPGSSNAGRALGAARMQRQTLKLESTTRRSDFCSEKLHRHATKNNNSIKSHDLLCQQTAQKQVFGINDTEHCRNLIVIHRQKILLCFQEYRAAGQINVLFKRLRFSGGTAHVQRTERGKFSGCDIPFRPCHPGGTTSFCRLLNNVMEPEVRCIGSE